jgi:2Fe-2S ferredoxin
MIKVTFMPMNQTVEAQPGQSLLEVAIDHDIPLQHACGGFCACTTCHVIVKEGFDSLSPMEEDEEERLDRATGVVLASRLGCQARVPQKPAESLEIVVEILHEGTGH